MLDAAIILRGGLSLYDAQLIKHGIQEKLMSQSGMTIVDCLLIFQLNRVVDQLRGLKPQCFIGDVHQQIPGSMSDLNFSSVAKETAGHPSFFQGVHTF